MFRTKAVLFSLLALSLLALATARPAAAQGSPAAMVNGGGTAAFDDPRFEGGTTQFSMGATVYADGSANGHFECIIKGVLSWSVMVTSGSLNPDGSVTIAGPSIVHFAGGGTLLIPDAFVIAYDGGPGVGMFCAGP